VIGMAVYMVERDLPGITLEQLGGAQKAAIETSRRFTEEGKQVRYIRSTYVPGEARCLCLFEADNAQRVRDVNEAAQIPYTRVVEALDLTP
jgi:muconolactone delta-isomerase